MTSKKQKLSIRATMCYINIPPQNIEYWEEMLQVSVTGWLWKATLGQRHCMGTTIHLPAGLCSVVLELGREAGLGI